MLAGQQRIAHQLLTDLATPNGFLASTLDEDNYKRIWSRDSMVCGLASLITKDAKHLEAFKASLLTLAEHQSEAGMIPSNIDPRSGEVSFGSLAGRIDAHTWFVLGACLYYKHTGDEATWKALETKVLKTREYLVNLEFNNKGWIYTPLSGNWADEYPVHGYTLYDNLLRMFAEKALSDLGHDIGFDIDRKTQLNFWPEATNLNEAYHKAGFQDALDKGVENFAAFLLPGYYDLRFDAGGNALALLYWRLSAAQKDALGARVSSFKSETGASLIPAFWPVITEDSYDWNLLKTNYSYSFKNHPGDFHNGGVWPVWMGLFTLGLAAQGQTDLVEQIVTAFENEIATKPNWAYQEYYNPISKTLGGKTQMGYSASGVIFMQEALLMIQAEQSSTLFD